MLLMSRKIGGGSAVVGGEMRVAGNDRGRHRKVKGCV